MLGHAPPAYKRAMATTEEQIAALENALAAGVLEVSEQGRTIKYASPAALQNAIDRLRGTANAATSGTLPIGLHRTYAGGPR